MSATPWFELTLAAPKLGEPELQWHGNLAGERFLLCVQKWRVPNPWPTRVWVQLMPRRARASDSPNLSQRDASRDPRLTREPVIVTLKRVESQFPPSRYFPIGEQRHWELGEVQPTPPATFGDMELLRIIVLWDMAGAPPPPMVLSTAAASGS